MATRGRMTFQKRQKEMARKDRQRMKVERRAHRKAAGGLEVLEAVEQLRDGYSTSELETPETMELAEGVGDENSTSELKTQETGGQAEQLGDGNSAPESETRETQADLG